MNIFSIDALMRAILRWYPSCHARVSIALESNPGIVDQRNSEGFQLLHAAAQANSPEIARLLLQNGADPNGLACVETELDGAQYREAIIGQGLDPNIRTISASLQTALFIASAHGHSEVVRVLVEAGADPDMGCLEEATPLTIACQENRFETVRLLLSLGAQVDLALKNGVTPLFTAAQDGHEEVVSLLLSNGADVGRRLTRDNQSAALHIASQNGHVGVVELLVKNGAYLNATNKEGCSGLMIACYWGRYAVAAFLLKAGANPDLPCHRGLTALKTAILRGHTEIVQLLTSAGANADVKSPIPTAVRRREAAIADFTDFLNRAEPWPTIREILVEIMSEVVAGSVDLTPDQTNFYRIRKNDGVDVFREVTDLIYPPAQACKSYGRCNRPLAPLLYASANPIAPVFEVGEMHKGDIFTLISYAIRDGMSLTVTPIGIGMPAEIPDCWFTDERRRALGRTNEFLNELFTMARADENYYKLTNEIIDTYFDFPGNSGFIYPSIRRSETLEAYENLAIKPGEVDNKLEIASVMVFRVSETDGQGRPVVVKCLLASSEVVDGRVNYALPTEDKELATMRVIDLKKTILQGANKLDYLDLRSSGVTSTQLGGPARDPNYVEVVCPECGQRYLEHSSSDLVRIFQLLDIVDVPFIGPGHECPMCRRSSSWDLWKESSEAAT